MFLSRHGGGFLGLCPKNPFVRVRPRSLCPAGRAVRALPLPIPVAYGRKRQKAAICAKAGDDKSIG